MCLSVSLQLTVNVGVMERITYLFTTKVCAEMKHLIFEHERGESLNLLFSVDNKKEAQRHCFNMQQQELKLEGCFSY